MDYYTHFSMESYLHRRRVRQLLTVIAVLLALCTLTVRKYVHRKFFWDSGLLFHLIGIFGWIVVIVGLIFLVITVSREAPNWLEEQETTDVEE